MISIVIIIIITTTTNTMIIIMHYRAYAKWCSNYLTDPCTASYRDQYIWQVLLQLEDALPADPCREALRRCSPVPTPKPEPLTQTRASNRHTRTRTGTPGGPANAAKPQPAARTALTEKQ